MYTEPLYRACETNLVYEIHHTTYRGVFLAWPRVQPRYKDPRRFHGHTQIKSLVIRFEPDSTNSISFPLSYHTTITQ